MKQLTIKARITILCTLLAAAIAMLALGVSYLNEQRMADAYFRDTLASTAQLARDDIRMEDGALEIDRNLDELPNVRVAIYNRDGDLIYGRQRFPLEFEAGSIRDAYGRDGTHWIVQDTLLELDGGESLWLRCFMSADAVESMRGVQTDILLVLMPVLILLAALGGWHIARNSVRPLSQITETAEGIAEGADLKKRIALTGARDEIYRTARVFDDMLERLDGAFERERRFTSDAAHELRTPVAGILAQSEAALAPEADENDRVEALKEIRGRSRHMSLLIQRLLGLARLDARRALEGAEPVDIAMLAALAAESMEERAQARDMRVSVDVPAEALVWGDQTMLTQAALNLTENAINHGREGGFVKLGVEKRDGSWRLSVTDDGPGIPPEHQERIFERFYQADASRSNRGFGLGLPLVRRIVQLHGGSLQLDSAPGRGSCFALILPEYRQEESDAK